LGERVRNQQVGGGGKERVMGSIIQKYIRFMCEGSIMKPNKNCQKGEEDG
jgi:hypothetical protein